MNNHMVFILGVAVFLPVLAAQDCQVSLPNGTVNGILTDTWNPQKQVCAYMGIPYAAAPVAQLRFEPPKTYPWNWGVLNSTFPNWCPQAEVPPPGINVSEDCLYLNVYQPQNVDVEDPEGLPVMIWFHGGSFTGGSSLMFTPTKLLARGDVILVVVHYRLGMLGFFSTGDGVVPGNNGLKDQAFSIRWVHENIKAFNGNPNKVTIFGQSAGGASAMFQLLSPLNKGLLHGVIAQSGTALNSWTLDRTPTASARLMATRLGCPLLESEYMVACLRQLPWQTLVLAQTLYTIEQVTNMSYAYATLTPVIEPMDTIGAFMSEEPVAIMKSGDIPDIPVMIGANKHDASFVLAGMYSAKWGPLGLDKNAEFMKHGIIYDILKYVNVPEEAPGNRAVASSLELAYLNGVNRSSWNESMPGLVDMVTVMAYKAAAQNTAEILSARNRTVYMYSFEHHSNSSLGDMFFDPTAVPVTAGITHADELIYIFDMPITSELSNDDLAFSDIMCDVWINFANTGNPTPTADGRFETWTPYNIINEAFIKLNVTPVVQYGYRSSWRPNGFEWN